MENIQHSSFLMFIALAFATIIFCKWLGFTRGKKQDIPPGPVALPIFGCLFQMLMNKPTFRWIHKLMAEMKTEIACIRLGKVHVIVVTSPELAREFLKKQDANFASRPSCMSGRITSHGYLTAALSPCGDQWKKMRRVLASEVLSPAIHRWFHDKRVEEADHLVRYIYNQCQNPLTNGIVNVRVAAQQYCGNVIRKLVFNKRFFGEGMEDGGPGMEEKEHVGALFTILSYLYGFSIADYIPWLEIFDFDGHKKTLKKAIESVTKYQDSEIAKRIQMWKDGIKKKEEDILDILINLKDSLNNPLLTLQEIKAQIIEIMIATVDNPSNAVEWAMAEMLNHPEILQRVTRELDEVVGRDRLVQESDLSQLNYTRACCKEAFRMHPTAPFNLPRVSTQDATVGGYFIPQGSNVLLSRPGLGRNSRIWEDALTYKPERHLLDDRSEVTLVDFELNMSSFSTGRRGCAGVLLGSTMTTMLLARLVQGFTWATPFDVPNVELAESKCDLLLEKPLIAHAKPRLNKNVYWKLQN
ncbi:hypothetical protein ACJIZ3_007115 [Penstemon smallii]|uniref:Cytochrome P450 n=1 Tax=Penstemon smallii TaxID=265156 RepID=A0ABD3S9L4_9LAMI